MVRSTLGALVLVGALGALAMAQVATEPSSPSTPPSQPGETMQGQATTGQPGMTSERKETFHHFVLSQVARLTAFATEFNLTDQQRQQIQNVMARHRQEIATQWENVWKHRETLHEAVMAQTPNDQAIHQAAESLGKAVGDFAVVAARLKTEISPILTEQQRTALRRYMEGSDREMYAFFNTMLGGREAPAVGSVPETTR
jgi:Spy/CpxP family protein refolding chaperone